VEVDGHYYSVPHTLIKRQLDVRLSGTGVELFHQGQRVAVHPRSHRRGGYSTLSAHLPERHRHYLEWTPERLQAWAGKIGPATAALIARLLAERPYPQQAYNACFGVLRLAKEYSEGRLEAACARALAIGTVSYKSLASILANGLDRRPLPEPAPQGEPIAHENLRGPGYYH
jgi:transposase